MESTYMFYDISSDELFDVEGGSTKVAAIVLAIVAAASGVGSYVASKAGNPVLSAGLGCVAAGCALAAAWLAVAPSL